MTNLNFIKTIKAKTWLILGLISIIVLLSIVSLIFKKKKQHQPLPSLKPIATNLPAFNPQIESIDDPLIGQEMEKIYQQKPWLKKLPLETKNYVLSYNWEKKAVRARLIINSEAKLSYDAQVEKIKKEVKQQLQIIGADLNQTKLYYTFGY